MVPVEQRQRARAWLTDAWVSVVLIPIFMFLSFVAGYVVYGLLGYVDGRGSTIWADLVVLVVAVLIAAVPCTAAVVFGRRATAAGERRGKVPLVLGSLAGTAFVVLGATSVVAAAL